MVLMLATPNIIIGGLMLSSIFFSLILQYADRDILIDVHIFSYPKSGTTWLEQCVLLLLNGGDTSLLNPSHKNTYSPAAPESRGKIWLEACIDQNPEVQTASAR